MEPPLELHLKPAVRYGNFIGSALLFLGSVCLFVTGRELLFAATAALFGYFTFTSSKAIRHRGPFAAIDSRGFWMHGAPISPSWEEIGAIDYVVHSPGPTGRYDLVLSLRDLPSFERRWNAAPHDKGQELEHPFVLPMAVTNVSRHELISRVEREWGRSISPRGRHAERDLAR